MITRTKLLVALAAGVATLGLAVPAVASASTAGPVTQVIKVTAVQNTKSVIFTKNSYTFIAALWQKSKDVGQVTVTCFFASPTAKTSNCGVDAYFFGTGFLFARVTSTGHGASGTINGGTNSFNNARGTINVVDITKRASAVTLRFTTSR
jgi:hypothetical protein